ncbi:MAG: energy transducer TonB, partial [Gammaproteobacteria bacterium]|nr:energy transducer TonB [Gammaproteobacteria bacterium]
VEHDEPLQAADLRREAGLHLMILSASKLANRYLASAVEDYEKLLGAEHVKTAVARLTLARFHIATSKNKPAERLLLDALPVLSNDQNARNHELKALGLLVEIYERSGDSDQATTYCQAIGRMTPWVSTQDYQPIFKMAPAYPIAALQRGQQGYVIVEYTVDKNGVVRSPTVVASQGSDLFAEPSLEAARRFRYAPRYVDGEPVDVPGVQNKFTFNIQR